jgi:hypothetical protein
MVKEMKHEYIDIEDLGDPDFENEEIKDIDQYVLEQRKKRQKKVLFSLLMEFREEEGDYMIKRKKQRRKMRMKILMIPIMWKIK